MLRETEKAVEMPLVILDDEPAQGDLDVGIMEFSDWLASCSDSELLTVGREAGVATCMAMPLDTKQRYYYGLDVWAAL